MDDLRLILLLIGAGIILAVYVWSRLQQASPRKRSPRREPPVISQPPDEFEDADIEQELGRMERLVMERDDEPVARDPERLLIISVVAAQGEIFTGPALVKAFKHNRLRFDEHEIYSRVTVQTGRERQVFGVANLVKPGTFPAADMESFTTPGITLFLQLPGPLDGVEAFDDFAHTAERLAVELGGEMRDERHCVLTHQALMQVRESIAEDRLHRKVAS